VIRGVTGVDVVEQPQRGSRGVIRGPTGVDVVPPAALRPFLDAAVRAAGAAVVTTAPRARGLARREVLAAEHRRTMLRIRLAAALLEPRPLERG